jgi:DNA-binding transcriptional regulator PaaX
VVKLKTMSIIMDILEGFWDMEFNYKGVKVNFFGVPRFLLDNENENTIRNGLCRLKKKRYIEGDSKKGWRITKSGKNFLEIRKILKDFRSPFSNKDNKTLLIMFDIPESRKQERAWLRKHLIKFNYFMIQKSVWVGPSPLPKEFVLYVKEIKLDSCIKSFRLSNPYKFKK